MIKEAIGTLIGGRSLSRAEAEAVMEEIMSGEATPAQIAGFLVALRLKGETVEEITGCAQVMRAKALPLPHRAGVVVDTCGTGGDGAQTFNISTTAAFVVAACGLPVAKHGNRSVSSRSGSADVLEALGVRIDLGPEAVARCLEEVGIGFLFAPAFHLAMKHVAGPRRELGVRTIFNLLGPLTNPAGTTYQVVGVYAPELTEPLAATLGNLGLKEALVVHGAGGLDELSTLGPNRLSRWRGGAVETFLLDPVELGLARAERVDLVGGDAATNAAITLAILKGERGPRRDTVLLNAGALLLTAGVAANWTEALRLATEALDSGAALAKLEALREFSQALGTEEKCS